MRSSRCLLASLASLLVFLGSRVPGCVGGPPSNFPRRPVYVPPQVQACEKSSCYPQTGNLLIGREDKLSASSTCGLDRQERFCIVSHLEDRKKCFWCDSRPSTQNNPKVNHRVSNIVYRFQPGTREKSWWQSKNGVENVTLRLDLEAEFHFTHLVIVFKTFRPAAMLIERSYDFGKTWLVYRYFAYNCAEAFPGVPERKPNNLTEVVCETKYSKVAPSTDGEIIFRVLTPNMMGENPYSPEVQLLLKMTNLRINFTKLHTLGDDLLDDRAEIQEKYYYAITDLTVRGSCSCYGHAPRCLPLPGVDSKTDMVHGRCECKHHTKGLNCELCEDFYNDMPWRPAIGKTTNACQKCNCNNHATKCHFDWAVYNATSGMSGGVCEDCRHNTEGTNCELCKPYFYKDPELDAEDPEVCRPCDCDPGGSVDEGICDPHTDLAHNLESGRCHCKPNVEGRRCDACKNGHWNFTEGNPDGCQPCTCDPLGVVGDRGCDVHTGECECKRNVIGRDCNQCAPHFWGLAAGDGCRRCDCDAGGSLHNNCDVVTGKCACRPNVQGRRCDRPEQHHFVPSLDSILYEAENADCEVGPDVNAISVNCRPTVREPFRDGREDTWTGPGFMRVFEEDVLAFTIDDVPASMEYDVIVRYEPQTPGEWQEATVVVERPGEADPRSPCANVRPRDDEKRVSFPYDARAVVVDPPTCLEAGKVYKLRIEFTRHRSGAYNPRASMLIDSVLIRPRIDSLPFVDGDPVAGNIWRQTYENAGCDDQSLNAVNGEPSEECKNYQTSIGFYIFNGATTCGCDPTGSLSHKCDEYGGHCPCKPNVVGRRCNACALGTYGFGPEGCKACDCNNIGSLDNFCDVGTGQCKCRPNTYGRQCDQCQSGYWNFPHCQQCECNGHADLCDSRTGACTSCRDNTEGHRCDRCVEGFYGDPRLGFDIPCRQCPCPGTRDSSNSFAKKCILERPSNDVICECAEGYAGLRCDVCADNYFGHPEIPGGSCEKCNCSDNIDLTKPNNCDHHTGKCLKCLHHTAGDNCEICESGYFGDAYEKTCEPCGCEILGTDTASGSCDRTTGQCNCFTNVRGVKCDECIEHHWKLASGEGCVPCDCDPVGSSDKQCNVYDGNCVCKTGFGGRQCDQCETDYWGDPNVQCYPCECDPYGTAKSQCRHDTGACVCKPGIGGYKCDVCARGFFGESCTACGECFDNWDTVISGLDNSTRDIIDKAGKIQTVGATGAYTKDFEEMDSSLNKIERVVNDTTNGNKRIVDFEKIVNEVSDKFGDAEKKVTKLNAELERVVSNNHQVNYSINDLQKTFEILVNKSAELEYNATKLQEANLEGALNLTRDAKEKAMKAADDVDETSKIMGDTERAILRTVQLIDRNYVPFNVTQKENDKNLFELQETLNELEMHVPELLDKMCGHTDSTCGLCGGAACGYCGDFLCDKGALTKAEKALEHANKTNAQIRQHDSTADDLLIVVTNVNMNASVALDEAQETHDIVARVRNRTDDLTNKSNTIIRDMEDFLAKSANTSNDVSKLANKILDMKINLKEDDVVALAKEIRTTASQVTNIDSIIDETGQHLVEAKQLKSRAEEAKTEAVSKLNKAKAIVKALEEAATAQNLADAAIKKANEEVEAVKRLPSIENQLDKANEQTKLASDRINELSERLGTLERNMITTNERSIEVKNETDSVVLKAENAKQQARELRQKYALVSEALEKRVEESANSRERAQSLLERAAALAGETQKQLKNLQTMEDLYNSHTKTIKDFDDQISRLNDDVKRYLDLIIIRWIYLEPILSGEALNRGGIISNTIFLRLDKDFRHVLRTIDSDCRISALTRMPGVDSLLSNLTGQLVQCQNTLETYMEEKRSIFPRFYFMSDDDLLELLGQAQFSSQNKESVMQIHIKKLFPGSSGVHLGPGAVCITAMQGQHGEKFTLDTPVDIDAPIETWLLKLENEIRNSLHGCIKKCLAQFRVQNGENSLHYPAQVLCLVQSISYTDRIEKCMVSHSLHEAREFISKDLKMYSKSSYREKENKSERCKLQVLTLQCHHYSQIVNELIEKSVTSVENWQWKKQLRFYMENDKIYACMGLARLPYTYEYLGINVGNIVRTQLTDQCFLILTQALHLGFAGNPFGPAGTGKTESVKALGGLLGRLVLIFNCDEGMDKQTMGRLLSGLALSGAWGCFDEFNRLEEKTLSDISPQLGSLLEAVGDISKTQQAVLNGKEIKVSIGCGIFVTMNPAGGSYGGRRNLPESINRLLRPCAMWEPCAIKIAEALLATHGFAHSQNLAEKLLVCFDMARTLLTESHHYDWGLRALKTVIGSCGSLMKEHFAQSTNNPNEKQEISIIVHALKLNTVSKLHYKDNIKFEEIINVAFSEYSIDDRMSNQLLENLKSSCETCNLIVNDNQIKKCIELYNQLKQRMGVVLVGPPGCGKTTLYTLLKHALLKSGENISHHVVNPKAIHRNDLLGYIDNDTRQWSDGVISTIGLQIVNNWTDKWSWVICDGDIDPEWIESLNSVLDDNRLLTLPSGWRIQFGNNVNFIFETHDLTNASPATITRMGIILLSEEECCYKEVAKSWLSASGLVKELSEFTENFFMDTLEKAIDWFENNKDEFHLHYHKVPLTQQILSFMDNDKTTNIEDLLATSLLKGLGSIVKQRSYNTLLEKISEWTGVSTHALIWKDSNNSDHSSLGINSDVFCNSKRINDVMELVSPWINSNQHFMIFGPPASGKSMIVESLIGNLRDCTIINFQCTPVLDINHIIQELKKNSAIKSGNSVTNKKIVLILKSLQRCKTDKWKSNEIQSFLFQILNYNGFWQRSHEPGSEGMQWFQLKHFLLIVTATTENFDSYNQPRLTNSLRVVTIMEPDRKELLDICDLHLSKSSEMINMKNEEYTKLATLNSKIISMYYDISENISNEVHYGWSPQDVINLCQCLKCYKLSDFNSISTALLEESMCIFKNRLTTDDDRLLFESIVKRNLDANAPTDRGYAPNSSEHGLTLELVEVDDFISKINKIINQFNNAAEAGNNIFGEYNVGQYDELRDLVTLVSRTVGGQNNGAVLIGVPGVGRRAAARIAAECTNSKYVLISSSNQFSSSIKNVLSSCGCDGVNTLLILEESPSSDEEVLGVIEALIGKSGSKRSISLPFFEQEIEAMISQMKTTVNGPKNYESFISNIRNCLGIVLLLDAKQNNLKGLLKSNPFLYRQCRMIWLDKLNDLTLKDIPTQVQKSIFMTTDESDRSIEISHEIFYEIHESISTENSTAPYRYIAFLYAFWNICFEKKKKINEKRLKLESGVKALTDAREEVASLKTNAAEQQKTLAEKQELAAKALNQIGATMQSATVQKQEMEELKRSTEIENVNLQERKKVIEKELSEVEPIIQEARTAVGDIRPESLSEVRSLRAPPEAVRDVLEGVLRLMGIADTSWHSMKNFLSKRGVKDEIRTFDAGNISKDNLVAVEKLIVSHSASFTEKNAKRASLACAPLASWVIANVKYANVLHKIAPLEMEQRALTRNLAEAEMQIENLSSNLYSVDERVAALKTKLNEYTKQATEVEIHLDNVRGTIEKAEMLVGKLSNEFERWDENLQNLSSEYNEIPYHAVVAAAFITYLTNESEENRLSYIKKWRELIPSMTTTISIKDFMLSRDDEIKWMSYGLSSDSSAVHNAIILNEVLKESKSGLIPLVIDPNDVVVSWLTKLLSDRLSDAVFQHDPKFYTVLQHSIRFGKTLIVKETSFIDENWSSLLRGVVPATMNGVNGIHPSFRLVLVSRDFSLIRRLSSYHKALLSIVDFSPQLQGLTDQLVHSAMKQEQPELQKKMVDVNDKMNSLKIQQEQLETQLLSQLSSGDILHNAELLNSLKNTQSASAEINKSLKEASKIATSISDQCIIYKTLATSTAAASLAISSLANKYPLISLSIRTVNGIYLKAIHNYKGMTQEEIIRNIIIGLLERVAVALNKENHNSVLLYLVHLIYPDHIKEQEWQALTCNVESYIKQETTQNLQEIPRWINEIQKHYLIVLQSLMNEWYSTLRLDDETLWKKFAISGEWDAFPSSIAITPFQKVLLTRAFNPTKFNQATVKAISKILGINQLIPSGDIITLIEQWSSPGQPVLVIGTSGTDPIDQIKTRASNIVGINNYKQMWLIENDSGDLKKNLDDSIDWAIKSGGWLVIVATSVDWNKSDFLRVLMTQFERLSDAENINTRVWIVAENDRVPFLLTSLCINVMMEAPTGIKSNLMKTLSVWGPDQNNKKGDPKTVRMEFSLALAHSILQERCSYIPQGWRYNYGFSWGDVDVGLMAVRNMNRSEAGGLCSALYSGRIYWEQDMQVLVTLIERHFDESVVGHTWKPLGLDISLPMSSKLQDYFSILHQFPSHDDPALLSLPQNIQTSREQQKGRNVLLQIKSLMFEQTAQELNKRTMKKKLSPILALWKKLNSGSDSIIKNKSTDFKVEDNGNGLKAIVVNEWENALNGIQQIHQNLAALHSSSNLEGDDRNVAMDLILDNTPKSWLKFWNGGCKTASYFITGFCERAYEARTRIKYIIQGKGTLHSVNLSTYYKPHCVFYAFHWETSKRLSLPPEKLALICAWNDKDVEITEEKLVLTDLWLEGAIWEGDKLQPCRTDTPIRTKAPPITLKFIPTDSLGNYGKKTEIEIPIFTSTDRNEMVFKIRASSADQFNKKMWLLNSTALVIS